MHIRFLFGFLGFALVAGCAQSDDISASDLVVETTVVVEEDNSDSSLASFFNDGPAQPTTEASDDDQSDEAPASTPARVEDPAPTEVAASEPERSDSTESDSTEPEPAEPEPTQPTDAAISVEPDSFLLEATHSVTVTGTDLVPGDALIVVGCQAPGEAIERSMTAQDIVERVSMIRPDTDCGFAVIAVVSDDGSFTTDVEVDVGPTTVILAGPQDGSYAVFTPIYLGS